jgi:hypothetical protein
MTSGHVILLGDSIFDNAAYVAGGPDVVQQLRGELPGDWGASLLAVDGAVTTDVQRQLARIPSDATHLVLSAGGNDALGQSGVLQRQVRSVSEAVSHLAEAQHNFRRRYASLLDAVAGARLRTAVCTIYDANFPAPEGTVIAAALSLFNDSITREAFRRGLALIDLRLICDQPDDYANPIEPSVRGGAKIAAAISAWASDEVHHSRSIVIA